MKKDWKTVRLGDVCEIQSGGTPSRSKIEYWKNGNIPWVKIGDFSGKYLEKTSLTTLARASLKVSGMRIHFSGAPRLHMRGAYHMRL